MPCLRHAVTLGLVNAAKRGGDDFPVPIAMMDQPITTQLLAGLPSDIIATRPDTRQAERELRRRILMLEQRARRSFSASR